MYQMIREKCFSKIELAEIFSSISTYNRTRINLKMVQLKFNSLLAQQVNIGEDNTTSSTMPGIADAH